MLFMTIIMMFGHFLYLNPLHIQRFLAQYVLLILHLFYFLFILL